MNKPLSLLISSHRFPLNGRVKLLTQASACLFILNLSFFGSDSVRTPQNIGVFYKLKQSSSQVTACAFFWQFSIVTNCHQLILNNK